MQCRGARLRLRVERRRDDNGNELAGLGLRMSGYLCTYEERSKTVSETSKWLGGPMKHEGMHYVFFFLAEALRVHYTVCFLLRGFEFVESKVVIELKTQ